MFEELEKFKQMMGTELAALVQINNDMIKLNKELIAINNDLQKRVTVLESKFNNY